MNSENAPLVSVVMITYNHEKFIQQAIEGVLMQEFTGQIELIIANDHSTDDTDTIINKIIKEHPRGSWIKYTNHSINIGMKANFIWALQQANGKYVALCEGDDYWIYPLKLQMQISFLELDKNYALSFTSSYELFEKEQIKTIYPINLYDLNFQKLLDYDWFIRTATIVYEKSKLDLNFLKTIEYGADFFLQLLIINTGDFHYLNEYTAIYRHHIGGISNSSRSVYLKRKEGFIKNLQNLNNYQKLKFDNIIKKNIKEVKIQIIDFAILNKKFEYLKLIETKLILDLVIHLIKRIFNKFFRSLFAHR